MSHSETSDSTRTTLAPGRHGGKDVSMADSALSSFEPSTISAYYSLVLPDFTYYVQTLTVTIGRRCTPAIPGQASSSRDAGELQADVDLGPVKSVSRLHARIEYDDASDCFVLCVIGRNGAWVDGVWSASGSRVPLGEKSQIQIASRTFHFVLPPAPEDSPSPSSSPSPRRERSPSLDITSFSPATTFLSCSPPAHRLHSPPRDRSLSPVPPRPKAPVKVVSVSGKGKGKGKGKLAGKTAGKTASKKRKKGDGDEPELPSAPMRSSTTAEVEVETEPVKPEVIRPEVMPPKPKDTYSQLTFRAIKAMGGKANLSEILQWIMDNYDWYRYNPGDKWVGSVRHNLSSGKAFVKLEKSTSDRGKGWFWSVSPEHERIFEEQEAKAALAAAGLQDAKKKKKDFVTNNPGVLPSPFANTPLVFRTSDTPPYSNTPPAYTTTVNGMEAPIMAGEPVQMFSSVSAASAHAPHIPSLSSASPIPPASTIPASAPPPASISSGAPTLDPTVRVPITVGPLPASYIASQPSGTDPPKRPPIVLHENALILDPVVFGTLMPTCLAELEAQGAQRALQALQEHLVAFLREKRGAGKNKVKKKKNAAAAATATVTPAAPASGAVVGPPANPALASAWTPQQPAPAPQDTNDELIVVDDSGDEGPAAKKRRMMT